MISDTWRAILELAQRAPSPHNVQPWKVRILSDTTCEVYIDIARTLPQEDTTGSFIISGMVMYLETMRYVAETYQQRLTYELEPSGPPPDVGLQLFARVTIVSDPSISPTFEREVISNRRTSRLGYEPQTISPQDQADLATLVASYGHTYAQTEDSTLIEAMLAEDTKALFQDFNTASYHDEIVSWFRFSKRSSDSHRDGLDYRCMRIPATDYYLSAHFPLMFKLPGLRSLFARRYRKLLGGTPQLAWITGPFWHPADAVVAGKMLIRFWLELARRGIYMHPFGNLITNPSARQTFESATASHDVWFVFRLGYTAEPPKSHRRPLEAIIIKETP